jgi:hypothetical protein
VLQQINNLSSDQRKLLKLFKRLDDKDQSALIAFAQFLHQREGTADDAGDQELSQDPILIERPAEESVVAAIKRLRSSYHMLDTSAMLTEASSLMTSHLIHGRSAPDVIDELEALFTQEYAAFLDNKNREQGS